MPRAHGLIQCLAYAAALQQTHRRWRASSHASAECPRWVVLGFQRPNVMAGVLLPNSGLERFIHAVHVGREPDPAAGRTMDEAVDVGAERVPADDARFLPAALDHVVAPLHDLVKVADLERDVVEPGLVGAEAEEQVVMLDVAFALHEGSGVQHAIDRPETQPAEVEVDRLLTSLFRNIQSHVQQSDGPWSLISRDWLVPTIDAAQDVVS